MIFNLAILETFKYNTDIRIYDYSLYYNKYFFENIDKKVLFNNLLTLRNNNTSSSFLYFIGLSINKEDDIIVLKGQKLNIEFIRINSNLKELNDFCKKYNNLIDYENVFPGDERFKIEFFYTSNIISKNIEGIKIPKFCLDKNNSEYEGFEIDEPSEIIIKGKFNYSIINY